jgi:hypothetical protein
MLKMLNAAFYVMNRVERSSLKMERAQSYPLLPSKRAARALSSWFKKRAERAQKQLFPLLKSFSI